VGARVQKNESESAAGSKPAVEFSSSKQQRQSDAKPPARVVRTSVKATKQQPTNHQSESAKPVLKCVNQHRDAAKKRHHYQPADREICARASIS
jgi:hypothetical protein